MPRVNPAPVHDGATGDRSLPTIFRVLESNMADVRVREAPLEEDGQLVPVEFITYTYPDGRVLLCAPPGIWADYLVAIRDEDGNYDVWMRRMPAEPEGGGDE